MKIYICGKISNKKNYAQQFKIAEEHLKKEGFDTINPVDLCSDLCEEYSDINSSALWQKCIRRCLVALLSAEGVATINNWIDSKGATLEVHIANVLALQVYDYKMWKANAYVINTLL